MTKRIYIRGNVGIPSHLKIFDFDTGQQLDDVRKLTIASDAAGMVQAKLVRIKNPPIVVDVVPGPPHQSAGRVVYLVSIDADKRTAHYDTIHRAKVEERSIDDDGQLQPRGQTIYMDDVVSDADVAQSRNPRGALGNSADRALTAALRAAVVKPKIDGLLLPAAGGIAHKVPVSTGAPYLMTAPKKAECKECFGTGLTGGFMHPCSKGCKP